MLKSKCVGICVSEEERERENEREKERVRVLSKMAPLTIGGIR